MSEYVTLDHFAITVRNLENAIAFYEINFDFEEIDKANKPDFKLKRALMQNGAYRLELIEPYDPEQPQTTRKSRVNLQDFLKKSGANHLAFITTDINSIYQKLAQNRVAFVTELRINHFFCLDLDDTLIEVKEKK